MRAREGGGEVEQGGGKEGRVLKKVAPGPPFSFGASRGAEEEKEELAGHLVGEGERVVFFLSFLFR